MFSMKNKTFTEIDEVVTFLKPLVKSQTIMGLIGDLGYGKTTLISKLLKEFGSEITHSPTFSLVNKYHLTSGLVVFHVDLYRLKNQEEIDSSGFWDLFSQEEAFFVVEWVDRIDLENLPLNFSKIIIKIEKTSESTRQYQINWL